VVLTSLLNVDLLALLLLSCAIQPVFFFLVPYSFLKMQTNPFPFFPRTNTYGRLAG
jgi:hypothetical protein